MAGSAPGAMRQAGMDRAFSPRTIVGSTPGAMRPAGIDPAFSPRDYHRFRTWRDAPGWYGSGLQPRTIVGSTPGAMRPAGMDRPFSPRTIVGSTPGATRPAGLNRAFSPPPMVPTIDPLSKNERTEAPKARTISARGEARRCRRKRKTRAVSRSIVATQILHCQSGEDPRPP